VCSPVKTPSKEDVQVIREEAIVTVDNDVIASTKRLDYDLSVITKAGLNLKFPTYE